MRLLNATSKVKPHNGRIYDNFNRLTLNSIRLDYYVTYKASLGATARAERAHVLVNALVPVSSWHSKSSIVSHGLK